MSHFIMLKNVRISFPHLFERPIINGDEGKRGGTLMLDPKTNATDIKAIEAEMAKITKEKFKDKRLPSDKVCLRDGEDKGREEYEGYKVLSANNSAQPVVLDIRAQPVTEASKNPIYAGCYVNAKIQLWAQNNTYGKRINATLIAVQFAGDGPALTESHVSYDTAVDGFDAVEAGEEDVFA